MPAYNDNVRVIAAAGTTGNNTHGPIDIPADVTAVEVEFIVEAAGATPTITFAAQTSLDGTNYVAAPVLTDTSDTPAASSSVQTAVGAVRQYVDLASGSRKYRKFQVVTTANTNVTYRVEVYLVRGGVT